MVRSPSFAGLLAFLTLALASAAQPHDEKGHEVVMPDAVKWVDGPPSLPPGAKIAVLEGDPTKEGPFVMRAKMPDGYKIMPHTHPKDERVTVLSGLLYMGMGGKFDAKAAQAMPAGAYGWTAAGGKRTAYTKRETVNQVHGAGPWLIDYVNPDDDPRKKK